MPPFCIYHVTGETCDLTVDHYRDRKTGPCFALAVLRCRVHECGFTLYPPGHVPYGRNSLAPQAPHEVRNASCEGGSESGVRREGPSALGARTRGDAGLARDALGADDNTASVDAGTRRNTALSRDEKGADNGGDAAPARHERGAGDSSASVDADNRADADPPRDEQAADDGSITGEADNGGDAAPARHERGAGGNSGSVDADTRADAEPARVEPAADNGGDAAPDRDGRGADDSATAGEAEPRGEADAPQGGPGSDDQRAAVGATTCGNAEPVAEEPCGDLQPPERARSGTASAANRQGDACTQDTDEALEPWRGTVFEGAIDAAEGRRWDRGHVGGSETWWSSQVRLLLFCVVLLGLDPRQSLELRHRIAEALGVDTLDLVEGANKIVERPGYRSRGRAVVGVLRKLRAHRDLGRILVAGHLAGLLGPPLWWDALRCVLRPLAFSSSGTDPP